MASTKKSFLKKMYETSPVQLNREQLHELFRVYQDLEKTLRSLKANAEKNAGSSLRHINVRKLIVQLSRSKRRLERKIGNTILLEKQHLKKKIRELTSNLSQKEVH